MGIVGADAGPVAFTVGSGGAAGAVSDVAFVDGGAALVMVVSVAGSGVYIYFPLKVMLCGSEDN